VKHLPDGEPIRLTIDRFNKMSPVFSPDGSHIAYTMVDPRTFRWDTQMLPVQGTPSASRRAAYGFTIDAESGRSQPMETQRFQALPR
jgi:hypothetical protein